VFDTSVSQLAAWDAEEGGPRLNVLAVNLSAKQLDDQATVGELVGLLDSHRIECDRVSVEVTESTVMINSTVTLRSLEGLRDRGLRVAIDDFGTGYSSLSYLHTLPVTTVKVDRSFVERLGSAEDSTPVVQAIVDMSHALGLDVVAEGVSSEDLRGRIAAVGCDSAQGFYWAMPMPAQEFAIWWKVADQQAVAHVT
jgi:EAL domain-containing protein (putative c-di-GMP-specific phosphodiesterase class I)